MSRAAESARSFGRGPASPAPRAAPTRTRARRLTCRRRLARPPPQARRRERRPRHTRVVVRFNRLGAASGFVYVVAGAAWVWLGQPPAPAWLLVLWFVAVGLVEAFIPGEANQVTLARAYLAAPALAYSVSP